MPFPRSPRHLLACLVLTAACGPEKGATAGDESTTASSTTTPSSTTAPTTTDPTTSASSTTVATSEPEVTTGKIPCEQTPEDCLCAPGCGVNNCIDGFWDCECVSCTATDPETDSLGESSTTVDTSSTGPDTTTTGGLEIDCLADPQVFPPFHKAPCVTTDECAIGFHQIDCCGSRESWGIAAADADEFTAAETTCDQQFPRCDCAPQPTIADDGQVSENDQDFAVACLASTCLTFIP